ncbi:NADH-quinone oxidoreductase subunit C/D [bacterium]|nr:NADH-quinone oxidoreductase subunit C/D [bacterium]
MDGENQILTDLRENFGDDILAAQSTADGIPTAWVKPTRVPDVLRRLKDKTYRMLYDLTAIDERQRSNRQGQPDSDFSIVYQLFSFDLNQYLRIKTPLKGETPSLPSVSNLWKNANWYEREVFDMFGVKFDGHPNLRRILMPTTWKGHPLRKDHVARATEMGPFQLTEERQDHEMEALRFKPEEWGMREAKGNEEFLFLNLGPQHPGTHGVLRVILQLDGEEIVDAVPDIGYHHRGAEKMGERQSWHTFIPYTDRIDYLTGVLNNLPYVLAVEQMAGIDVPDRAKVIRVMLCELFRISSHLVWYGTFAQDIGSLSPVFFTFNDRERILDIVQAITGARMHPSWFRIGGVAHDLPQGWEQTVRDFIKYLPPRIKEYDGLVMQNRIFQGRTKGIGAYNLDEAIEWGVTGPGLRACGLEWDFRKKRPYSGYDQFEFDVPTAQAGDCFARAEVRIQEIYQSLRIIEQCVNNMPPGDYKSRHPLTTPPIKDRTMHDIETLITHFLNVTWGPVIPANESFCAVESSKGNNGYYLVSDGGTISYRTRIRTPSFPHMQMMPSISRGHMVPDVLAILGSIDFVLADVDR